MFKFHTTAFYKKRFFWKLLLLLELNRHFKLTAAAFCVASSDRIIWTYSRGTEVFVVQKSRLKCYYGCQGQHHLILLLWIGAILIYILQSCIFSFLSKAWTFMMMDSYWLHSNLYAEYAGTKHHFSHTCTYANIYTSVIFIPNHGVFELQSRPIQMRIYHSNERCRISAILRRRGKLF